MTAIKRLQHKRRNTERSHLRRRSSLLVVSDQPELVSEVEAVAAKEFQVETANGAGAALQLLAGGHFDLLLADQAMRSMSGRQLLAWAQQHTPRTARLLLVGPSEVEAVTEALGQGAVHACALHPLRADALLRLLRGAARQSLRERQQAPLLDNLWQMCLELQYTLLEQGRRMEQAAAALIRSTGELEDDNRCLRRDNLEMASQALIDPLTGLLNRRAIEGIAEHEVNRRDRYPAPLTVGLIDADGLKAINTRHHLPGGDAALVGIARALSGALRAADRLGRLGGDEWLLLAPQTDAAGARLLAERLRATVEQTSMSHNGEALAMTVSIGLAVAEVGLVADFRGLRDVAAAALQEAKAAGRNRAVVRVLAGSTHS